MGLRDILTRYFQTNAEPATPPRGEIGLASESAIYSSRDFTRWNPDLLLSYKGVQVYDRMLTDDQVKAVLEFKIGAVVSREYYFDCETDEELGEKNAEHEKIEEVFEAAISKMHGNFRDKLIEILGAVKHGFTISEKIFQPITVGGKSYWGLKDIKTRPFASFQQGFVTDQHGNLLAVKQNAGAQLIDLPLDKIIHFVHRPEIDRIYGESDLRAAYRAWWSKDIAIKFQNIHLERAAGGFIWAQIDGTKGSLDNTQKANLEKVLNTLSAQSGIHVPASVTLNAIQPLKTDAYERAVAQHDKSIAKALLVPNLLGLSEQGDVGSYSQSEVQLKVFFWILDLIASRLEETLNEQLFKQLAQWNFGTDEFPPFRFEPISDDEKERIAKTWADLVSKGAVTKTDTDEAHLRQLLSFPEKGEADEPPLAEMPIPGQKPLSPEDQLPEEQPDNEKYLKDKPKEVRQQFEDRPWLKRVNFESIESTMTKNDSALSEGLSSILAKVKVSLDDQVVKIGGERSWGNVKPAEIIEVKIPKVLVTAVRKLLRERFSTTLDESYSQARKELPRKQFARVSAGMDKTQTERFLASRAMKIAGVIEKTILDAVQQELENAIKYDRSLRDTIEAIEKNTQLVSLLPRTDSIGRAINIPARLENISRTNIADAVNQARMSLFSDPALKGFVQAYEYSAILDDRTTPLCLSLHGKIRKNWHEFIPPNHFQCRSILIPVTEVDGWNGQEDQYPANIATTKIFPTQVMPPLSEIARELAQDIAEGFVPAKSIKEAEIYARRNLVNSPITTNKALRQSWERLGVGKVDLSGLDLDMANALNKELTRVLKGVKIDGISKDLSKDTLFSVQNSWLRGHGVDEVRSIFRYNPDSVSTVSKFEKIAARNSKTGFIKGEGTLSEYIDHEFGHIIDLNYGGEINRIVGGIKTKVRISWSDSLDSKILSQDEEKIVRDIKSLCGRYSAANIKERFAELYRVYKNKGLPENLSFVEDVFKKAEDKFYGRNPVS